jgi:serine/threonine-protein kinase
MDTSTFPNALPAGTALRGGDFILQTVLGQGGFGITYRALDRGLQRAAAIKEFFPQGAQRMSQSVMAGGHSDADFVAAREKFLNEARTLAQFNNPYIVNVYTIFEENHTAYMVMEFVDGRDLDATVEARGALPQAEAITIAEQIGSALQEVHRAGMLHLDVKPENILLETARTPAGSTPGVARAVLLDFGLTRKLETATGYATTRLDAFARFGTAGYAPLEQYSRTGQTGVTTDVYALAATMYFTLTGRAPTEATERASGAPLPDARSFNPDVTPPIAAALESGLAMPASARPQSVAAFLELLRAAGTTLQTAPAAPPQSTPASSHAPRPYRDEDVEDDFDTGDSHEEAVEEMLDQLFGTGQRAPAPRRTSGPSPFPRPMPQPMPRRDPFGFDPFGRVPLPRAPGVQVSGCGCAPGCLIFLFFLFFVLPFLNALFGIG